MRTRNIIRFCTAFALVLVVLCAGYAASEIFLGVSDEISAICTAVVFAFISSLIADWITGLRHKEI